VNISKLEQLFEIITLKPKRRLVVAYGQDGNTIGAVEKAVKLGLIEATLIGDKDIIQEVCKEKGIDSGIFEIIDEKDEKTSGIMAVDYVNEGKAHFIMKGLIGTDKYMRAILDKQRGLLPPGGTLSHITVFETENYHKLLIAADVAVIPKPDLKQKIAICSYLIKTARAFGIDQPKIAVISANEKVNPKIESAVDASIISKMFDRGQIKGGVCDGPLALDVAINKESADIKGIKSAVAGDADCLLFPNIEAGNVFYKTMTKFAKAELGACVVGAKAPAILPSRGDSELSKLYSIAIASLLS